MEESVERHMRVLCVTVHRGVDLPAMDSTGFSDPYCTVQLSGSKRAPEETKCVKQTLNPVWEDSFELDVMHSGQVLQIDVYDRDWMLGIPLKPDYIGRVNVELSSLGESFDAHTGWYPIMDGATNTPLQGKIQLTLQMRMLEEMEAKPSFWGIFRGEVPPSSKVTNALLSVCLFSNLYSFFFICAVGRKRYFLVWPWPEGRCRNERPQGGFRSLSTHYQQHLPPPLCSSSSHHAVSSFATAYLDGLGEAGCYYCVLHRVFLVLVE